jgi:hypothetical protein
MNELLQEMYDDLRLTLFAKYYYKDCIINSLSLENYFYYNFRRQVESIKKYIRKLKAIDCNNCDLQNICYSKDEVYIIENDIAKRIKYCSGFKNKD